VSALTVRWILSKAANTGAKRPKIGKDLEISPRLWQKVEP